ncbi:ATP-binding protein [Amycolatopsis cihanbeyliensis]|uniref:Serine/threonine-protein kinase RsbW n=1 Tax=Amycolatopsis cihanbeyliensis TaxID=1128664 RepID=A0A542DME1_AMYCI|nr:ATP-binding protein [Amycolatopsis cihanbeyliensis]TQJ04256.1 serine/threonine-protein kinase RsbW [Amycolatopsis cihanbeyliensis]
MSETEPPSQRVGGQDDIELRLGADLVHLPLIRSVAASIAMRADFDLDTIADLRLAVDEACSTLITRALPATTMVCRFTIKQDELRFTGAVSSADQHTPSTGSFGWRVLTTLADSAASWVETDGDATRAHWVHVELAKRRPVIQG